MLSLLNCIGAIIRFEGAAHIVTKIDPTVCGIGIGRRKSLNLLGGEGRNVESKRVTKLHHDIHIAVGANVRVVSV